MVLKSYSSLLIFLGRICIDADIIPCLVPRTCVGVFGSNFTVLGFVAMVLVSSCVLSWLSLEGVNLVIYFNAEFSSAIFLELGVISPKYTNYKQETQNFI